MNDLQAELLPEAAGLPDRIRILQTLADEISDLTGSRRIEVRPDSMGITAFCLKVRSADVTVTHDDANPLEAWVHVFVGTVSQLRELETLRLLLQTNMQLRSDRGPIFGLDAKGREIVLRFPYRLAGAAGHDFLRRVEAARDAATRWLDDQPH